MYLSLRLEDLSNLHFVTEYFIKNNKFYVVCNHYRYPVFFSESFIIKTYLKVLSRIHAVHFNLTSPLFVSIPTPACGNNNVVFSLLDYRILLITFPIFREMIWFSARDIEYYQLVYMYVIIKRLL